jgi:hypothetical protein
MALMTTEFYTEMMRGQLMALSPDGPLVLPTLEAEPLVRRLTSRIREPYDPATYNRTSCDKDNSCDAIAGTRGGSRSLSSGPDSNR